jgi:hypothetical protein
LIVKSLDREMVDSALFDITFTLSAPVPPGRKCPSREAALSGQSRAEVDVPEARDGTVVSFLPTGSASVRSGRCMPRYRGSAWRPRGPDSGRRGVTERRIPRGGLSDRPRHAAENDWPHSRPQACTKLPARALSLRPGSAAAIKAQLHFRS